MKWKLFSICLVDPHIPASVNCIISGLYILEADPLNVGNAFFFFSWKLPSLSVTLIVWFTFDIDIGYVTIAMSKRHLLLICRVAGHLQSSGNNPSG